MREVGRLSSEKQAQVLADYLLTRGIESELDPSGEGEVQVWILDDTKLDEACEIFDAYKADPDNPRYREAAKDAATIKAGVEKEEREAARLEKKRDVIFRRSGIVGAGVVTLSLIVVSVIVTIACGLGDNLALVRKLAIADTFEFMGRTVYYKHLAEVRGGQVWRLITPIFMHFGWMHIIFNMMWMLDLGNMVERIKSSLFLIIFVLVTAVVSNVAQYYWSGPSFGGMSGIVYGLLGYVWMQSKFNPWSSFVLHSFTVQMMLFWLVLCFTGLVGNVANVVHLTGLLMGVAWGYIDAKRAAR